MQSNHWRDVALIITERIIIIDLGKLSQIFSVRFIICEQGINQFIALWKHGSVFKILEEMEKN